MAQPLESPVRHYQGEEGRDYFLYQEKSGRNSHWNLFIWENLIAPEDELLEFGCGGGQLLNLLPARRKIGVEINPVAVEHARAYGLEIHESLAELAPASFDKVISSHVLEHVESPCATLAELRRLLRPTGRLILLLPMDDWRTPIHRRFKPDDVDMHLYTWTPLTLGNLLKSAGFRPINVEVLTHCWPPRGGSLFQRIHPRVFHWASYWTAVLLKRRQLLAVASVEP